MKNFTVQVNISARHIHLCKKDLDILFGSGYELTKLKELYQPGEFAANETVTLKNGEKTIDNVRILGPLRSQTQVEISKTDSFALKVTPPIRNSGDLEGSGSIEIVGPKGALIIDTGLIIAHRHIHLSEQSAKVFNIENGQSVSVIVDTDRGGVMHNVICKVKKTYKLEMHVDTDEGNAFGIEKGCIVKAEY